MSTCRNVSVTATFEMQDIHGRISNHISSQGSSLTCAQHSQSTILNPKQFPTAGMNYFNISTSCITNTSSHTEINQNHRVHITEDLTQLKRIICQQQRSETSADSVYHSNTICLLIDNFAVIVKPPWNPNCIQKFKKICKNIMTY
jgi:hypothetical protein